MSDLVAQTIKYLIDQLQKQTMDVHEAIKPFSVVTLFFSCNDLGPFFSHYIMLIEHLVRDFGRGARAWASASCISTLENLSILSTQSEQGKLQLENKNKKTFSRLVEHIFRSRKISLSSSGLRRCLSVAGIHSFSAFVIQLMLGTRSWLEK